RKRRPAKPLALMARDLGVVRRYVATSPVAEVWLQGSAAPIVLLPASGRERVCAEVAPGVASLGFMLPHTPLHHLLFEGVDRPLVFTSGNLCDEPPCTDNDEARRRLAAVADFILLHDRDIANRIDDSVVRVVAGEARMLRRARGCTPAPLRLPAGFEHAPELLAMGGELKNTFCLIKDGAAILSPHIGDLESALAQADYLKNLALFTAMFQHRAGTIAIDAHPDYISSKLGRERAAGEGIGLEVVQHHHAHVAACLAENGRPLAAPRVLGIALDGLGYGSDQSLWGGEFLLADYRGFQRLAALQPVPMLGGAQAIREPWRSAYAHLRTAFTWSGFAQGYGGLDLHRQLRSKPLAVLDAMLAAGINCPMASSCGRLFDAVAAALGVCAERAVYEGQAAIELEALAEGAALAAADSGYPFALTHPLAGAAGSLLRIDAAPMWQALLADLHRATPRPVIALRFHRGLAHTVVRLALHLADGKGRAPRRFDTIALTGGVFQNALLFEAVHDGLVDAGFAVLSHRRVPSHDGGLALGQAAVAAARALHRAALPSGELACA
ncbi:MAG: carbamoyltransferase HypF, partial [Ramlibacter sp.]|nr:carbamoyltransferase HypF [Ramlibacter sp.]